MGKIGSNNLGHAKRVQQNRVAEQNRKAVNNAELKDVKGDVATGIGAQDKKTKKKDETKKKAPTETFTPTKVEKTDDENAVKSQTEVKSEQQETGQVGNEQVGDGASAPQEKSTDDLQTEFLNSFASNVEPDKMREIADKANKSLDGMAAKGIEPPPQEVVMAAHSYNHAKSVVSQKMPGASQKEVRAAAKNDPELAKAVKLLDDSSAFINAKKNETLAGASGENGQTATAPGDSAKSGAPSGAPQGGSADGVNPFADAPGDPNPPGGGDEQPPNGPIPPDSGQKPPWHVSPETQAKMMHENHSTMLSIMETMNQMAKERRETMAKIMQINAETATSISEIFTQIHARRAAAHHKHFQLYMKILTDSWG